MVTESVGVDSKTVAKIDKMKGRASRRSFISAIVARYFNERQSNPIDPVVREELEEIQYRLAEIRPQLDEAEDQTHIRMAIREIGKVVVPDLPKETV